MEDLMYQFSWLSSVPQQSLIFQDRMNFSPTLIEDDHLKLFDIEAYRSWASLEQDCHQQVEEAHEAMHEAEAEINSTMDSAMAEFKRFSEELEREGMEEYYSLVNAGEAARKMGKLLENAATVASYKYVEAAVYSATKSMRSAWKGISSRKVHPH